MNEALQLFAFEPKDDVQFAETTLEGCSKVVVSTRIPELHVLVCPPCNALLYQRNQMCGTIGINMIELQSV